MNTINTKLLVTVFLLVNAVFWGLYPHSDHCSLLAKLGVVACPPHSIHVLTGLVAFLGAVLNQQGLPKDW